MDLKDLVEEDVEVPSDDVDGLVMDVVPVLGSTRSARAAMLVGASP